jgi:predicted acetylornithine/succinylornithine family transaminase
VNIEQARSLEQQYLIDVYSPIRMPRVMARGEGVRLWDTEGREYLDLISGGRAVCSLGHCHPRVVAAVDEQMRQLIHTSNDFYTEPMLKLARMLGEACVCRKVFFCNSGAEANEAAIKLARKHAKRDGNEDKYEIVTAFKSFHGRTLATIAATGQPKYQRGFEPLPPGFRYCAYNDLDDLTKQVSAKTCAIMLEPVLGESGVYPATREFLAGARQLCDQHGALLILDEVQTGLGRTGRMFAYEHHGIEPDIITLAKALGGGLPIGAMLAKDEVAGTFVPGDHASTFGGSAAPAAAGCAVMEAIREEGLVENARDTGAYLLAQLRALAERYPIMREVRGIGMMLAVDLGEPQAGTIKAACFERGLLINTVGDSMLRLVPAIVLQRSDVDRAVAILDAVLAGL